MKNSKTNRAPGSAGRAAVASTNTVTRDIAHLQSLQIDGLRALWRQRFRTEPPSIQSGDIVRRLIAWRIQADAYGDLDAQTMQRIRQLMRPDRAAAPLSLKAGTILIREWRGVEHRVLVLDGGFEHRGTRYKSLTQVARAITGTRWSGPRFFGLDVAAATSNGAPS